MPICAVPFAYDTSRNTGEPSGNASSVATCETLPLTEIATAGAGAVVVADADGTTLVEPEAGTVVVGNVLVTGVVVVAVVVAEVAGTPAPPLPAVVGAGADDVEPFGGVVTCGVNGFFDWNMLNETSSPGWTGGGASVSASSPGAGAGAAAVAVDADDVAVVAVVGAGVLAWAGGAEFDFSTGGTSIAATTRNSAPPIAAAILARFSRCLIGSTRFVFAIARE